MGTALTIMDVLLLLGGIAIGLLIGHFFLPAVREAKRLRVELDTLRTEHETYKSGVSEHFVKTAELVGEMTKSYARVYDHLAGGAQKFCFDIASDNQIPFGEPLAISDAAIVTATSAPTGDGIEEPGAVDAAPLDTASATTASVHTEDDPDRATEGMMPEPGLMAVPGELEDGAPDPPRF